MGVETFSPKDFAVIGTYTYDGDMPFISDGTDEKYLKKKHWDTAFSELAVPANMRYEGCHLISGFHWMRPRMESERMVVNRCFAVRSEWNIEGQNNAVPYADVRKVIAYFPAFVGLTAFIGQRRRETGEPGPYSFDTEIELARVGALASVHKAEDNTDPGTLIYRCVQMPGYVNRPDGTPIRSAAAIALADLGYTAFQSYIRTSTGELSPRRQYVMVTLNEGSGEEQLPASPDFATTLKPAWDMVSNIQGLKEEWVKEGSY